MAKIHSHYDNLKVSRDAPQAVIRAAYRALSQQYHPDISTLPDAARIMAIVNRSYDVLSDPAQRQAHDAWLHAQEQSTRPAEPTGADVPPSAPREAPARSAARKTTEPIMFWPLIGKLLRGVPWQVWLVIAVIAMVSLWPKTRHEDTARPWESASPPVPVPQAPTPSQAVAEAPAHAPRPAEMGYLDGRSDGYSGGYSTISVDNSSNNFDVYVKLVASFDPAGGAARIVYIPAHQSFTMRDIAAGEYEVRYMDLDSGAAFKSHPFSLTEESMSDGVQYSQITMTLYTVHNGNTRMQSIGADEF